MPHPRPASWLRLIACTAPLLAACGSARQSAPPAAWPETPASEATPYGADAESAPPGPTAPPYPGPSYSAPGTPAPSSGWGSPEPEPATLPDAERAFSGAAAQLEQALGPAGAQPLGTGTPACQTACRALSSLERATAAICRLTAAEDRRCVEARTAAARYQQRASACGCPPG